MFRQLLEKVRVKGHIEIGETPFIRDMLPIIYRGEADPANPRAVAYWNSGGRSLIFERGNTVYRVKGVDPFGTLTERVATSTKNRIENVSSAHLIARGAEWNADAKKGLMHLDGKPFGVCYHEQAECEERAFEALAKAYALLGIENPCEFVTYNDTGIEVHNRRTYQTAFRLPSVEADMRVHEWDRLLAERLDQCTPAEIAAKNQSINRLYGRFVYWAGVNTALLSLTGLLPTAASFVPQNWVIGRHNEGYGIFRVDHTSTQKVDSETAFQALMKSRDGVNDVPEVINEFSIFPSRAQVAACPQNFLKGKKARQKFSQILFMREGIQADENKVIEVHKKVFQLGLMSTLQGSPPMSIPEDLFRDALS